jgi:hypothetical protein
MFTVIGRKFADRVSPGLRNVPILEQVARQIERLMQGEAEIVHTSHLALEVGLEKGRVDFPIT